MNVERGRWITEIITLPINLLRDTDYKIMASRSRARSGTFYLRDSLDTDGAATFVTSSTDISSFVNVLEGELLRIKQVWWQWGDDNGGPIKGADLTASKGSSAVASVSTETRTNVGNINSSNVVSQNTIYAHADATPLIEFISNETSANPKDLDDGFLVATDALHLNVNMGDAFANEVRAYVMMECEIVKLSLSDAQAVLVSQTVG